MRRLLKRELTLLTAFLADVYLEFSPRTVYKRLWWPGYKPQSVYAAISRMVKIGDIKRERKANGEIVLHLQTKGGRFLDELIPLRKFQKKTWEGKWRIVIFDIAEKSRVARNAVRRKLIDLGFGKWQKSVYVTPHDLMPEMNEYLKAQLLFPAVVCFESRRIGMGSDREFADFIFKTTHRNKSFWKLAMTAKKLREKIEAMKIEGTKAERKFHQLWEKYLALLMSDPFLPTELLPKPWYAEEAKKSLKSLSETLLE